MASSSRACSPIATFCARLARRLSPRCSSCPDSWRATSRSASSQAGCVGEARAPNVRASWLNADCAERAVGGIESRLHRFAEEAGGPVVLIGQSRGGELARVVALRNPDLVSSLVMLGSPVLDPLRVGPVVLGAVRYVARLGDLGVPGMFSSECGDGACCARFREDLLAPLPAAVRAVSIYSRSRRHRRLGGLPGPDRPSTSRWSRATPACLSTRRSTGCSPASSTRRAIDGLDEPHGRLVPAHRGTRRTRCTSAA